MEIRIQIHRCEYRYNTYACRNRHMNIWIYRYIGTDIDRCNFSDIDTDIDIDVDIDVDINVDIDMK